MGEREGEMEDVPALIYVAGHVSAVLTLDGEVAGFLKAVGEGVGAAGEEEEHLGRWFGFVGGKAG
jgi:hypothetical protein